MLIHMHKLCGLAGVICTVMFSSLLFAPIAYANGSTVNSNPTQGDGIATLPTELWSFTANTTTNNVSWQSGVVADGVAYLWNTETYTVPGEQSQYLSMFPLVHSLGNIYALNAQNGAKLWNYTVKGSVQSMINNPLKHPV